MIGMSFGDVYIVFIEHILLLYCYMLYCIWCLYTLCYIHYICYIATLYIVFIYFFLHAKLYILFIYFFFAELNDWYVERCLGMNATASDKGRSVKGGFYQLVIEIVST